jgi:hypothetical protein
MYQKLSDLEFCSKLEQKANDKAMTAAAGQAAANQKWEHLQLVFERCHEYHKPATKHNQTKVG